MEDALTPRQQDILRLLLAHAEGLTIDEMVAMLGITRPAVRQHMAPLEAESLVERGEVRSTGGRPGQRYVLGAKGRERFPRQYGWFAGLLMGALKARRGEQEMLELMRELADGVAEGLAPRVAGLGPEARVAVLAALMNELGYEASAGPGALAATNCVFHHLAAQHPEVCEFDLELMRKLLDADIEHTTCMIRGGEACRFRVKAKA